MRLFLILNDVSKDWAKLDQITKFRGYLTLTLSHASTSSSLMSNKASITPGKAALEYESKTLGANTTCLQHNTKLIKDTFHRYKNHPFISPQELNSTKTYFI